MSNEIEETEEVPVETCDDCSEEFPVDDDAIESYSTSYGSRDLCESCAGEYTSCDECGVLMSAENGDVHTADNYSGQWCESCFDDRFEYCEECDTYVASDEDHGHEHDESGACCSAPAPTFKIRLVSDGSDTPRFLANNEQTQVMVDAGHISAHGISLISSVLRNYAHSMAVVTDDDYERQRQIIRASYAFNEPDSRRGIGDEYKTDRGSYAKRLKRLLYAEYDKTVLPDETYAKIGVLAAEHSAGLDVTVAFTRDLNLPAYEFAHEDSCWWQSYSYSRCTLKSNGGFALRSFNEHGVTGRAWVMPVIVAGVIDVPGREGTQIYPTQDTETPDAFLVFNCYGEIDEMRAARLMMTLTGLSHTRVSITGSATDRMYVNGETGHLLATPEVLDRVTKEGLHNDYRVVRLNLNQHARLRPIEEYRTRAAEKEVTRLEAEVAEREKQIRLRAEREERERQWQIEQDRLEAERQRLAAERAERIRRGEIVPVSEGCTVRVSADPHTESGEYVDPRFAGAIGTVERAGYGNNWVVYHAQSGMRNYIAEQDLTVVDPEAAVSDQSDTGTIRVGARVRVSREPLTAGGGWVDPLFAGRVCTVAAAAWGENWIVTHPRSGRQNTIGAQYLTVEPEREPQPRDERGRFVPRANTTTITDEPRPTLADISRPWQGRAAATWRELSATWQRIGDRLVFDVATPDEPALVEETVPVEEEPLRGWEMELLSGAPLPTVDGRCDCYWCREMRAQAERDAAEVRAERLVEWYDEAALIDAFEDDEQG